MTIVFPLRIVMSSVKHIVAAGQSWNGKRGRQQRVKLQSVEALTMTDDQGLLQFLFYPFSVHESEITINVTNYEFQIAKDKLQGIKGPSGPMTMQEYYF